MLVLVDEEVFGQSFIELVISENEYTKLREEVLVKEVGIFLYGKKELNISIRVDARYQEERIDPETKPQQDIQD